MTCYSNNKSTAMSKKCHIHINLCTYFHTQSEHVLIVLHIKCNASHIVYGQIKFSFISLISHGHSE